MEFVTTKNLNHAVQQGKILYKRGGKKVASVLLETTISSDKKHRNTPRIMCFGEMAAKLSEFKTGSFVTIEGHFENREEKNENGRLEEHQDIVAEKIERASQGIDGIKAKRSTGKIEKLNSFEIAGSLQRIQLHGKMWILTILSQTSGTEFLKIRVMEYPHNKKFLSSLNIKDNLYVKGIVQTYTKEGKGKKKYFEDLIGHELAVL